MPKGKISSPKGGKGFGFHYESLHGSIRLKTGSSVRKGRSVKLNGIWASLPSDRAFSGDGRFANDFVGASNVLSVYLIGKLRKEKVETPSTRNIYLLPVKSTKLATIKARVIENDLSIYVPVDEHALYEALSDLQQTGRVVCEVFLGALTYAQDNEAFKLPHLVDWLSAFAAQEYRLEWCHKSQKFRPEGLQAKLTARLDSQVFELHLKLERGDEILVNEVIASASTDERLFCYKLGTMAVEEDCFVVRPRGGVDYAGADQKRVLFSKRL